MVINFPLPFISCSDNDKKKWLLSLYLSIFFTFVDRFFSCFYHLCHELGHIYSLFKILLINWKGNEYLNWAWGRKGSVLLQVIDMSLLKNRKKKKKVIDMYKFSYLLLSVMCQNFLEKMPFKEWLGRDSTCHFYFM